jgi:hypothetical protein
VISCYLLKEATGKPLRLVPRFGEGLLSEAIQPALQAFVIPYHEAGETTRLRRFDPGKVTGQLPGKAGVDVRTP